MRFFLYPGRIGSYLKKQQQQQQNTEGKNQTEEAREIKPSQKQN